MKLAIIQPCMGRRAGEPYIRSWQMEPLAPAVLATLTPPDVEISFHDDRMEEIPFDEPVDLVAITVETYSAKRSYQIASEYRRRGIPVVMGGFHPTLVPEEVVEYAEAVVVGEAEGQWPRVIEDFRAGRLQRIYRRAGRPSLAAIEPDRSLYQGKRYLPIGLVEASRGCKYRCEFCAIQANFRGTQTHRPVAEVVEEIRRVKRKLWFIVDDNVTGDRGRAKELFRALIPLKIRWVGQASIDFAHDEECLRLMKESGCQMVLTGFESLDPARLRAIGKEFNTRHGGYDVALSKLRKYGIQSYATFILGLDGDEGSEGERALQFSKEHRFFTAAFNHLLPIPGTPLFERLRDEGRLLHEKWWLDDGYHFGMVPFQPTHQTPEQVHRQCLDARRSFFGWRSILRRSLDLRVNCASPLKWVRFFTINLLMRREVGQRDEFPLGDESYREQILKVGESILTEAS